MTRPKEGCPHRMKPDQAVGTTSEDGATRFEMFVGDEGDLVCQLAVETGDPNPVCLDKTASGPKECGIADWLAQKS